MKVIVGSLNPVKIEAVKKAFSLYFKDIDVLGKEIDSGVSHNPMTEEETIKGAINRAKLLIEIDADYYVGIEGGNNEEIYGMSMFGYVAILDKNGNIGIGSTGKTVLPNQVADKLKQGKELGHILDEILNSENNKHKEGAFGYFTKNKVTREDALIRAVTFALVKFIRKEHFDLK